ncbi:hypothetical protein AALN73_01015 [Bacteroides stercorirosoris]|nr:hypothetical protein [Bacteroides stercorirosoris]
MERRVGKPENQPHFTYALHILSQYTNATGKHGTWNCLWHEAKERR